MCDLNLINGAMKTEGKAIKDASKSISKVTKNMQDDRKIANALFNSGIITVNEAREMCGFARMGVEFDVVKKVTTLPLFPQPSLFTNVNQVDRRNKEKKDNNDESGQIFLA